MNYLSRFIRSSLRIEHNCYYLLSVAVILVPAVFVQPTIAQSFRPNLEYQIKASLLFNVLPFVEWPSEEKHTELSLCIVGRDRFGNALDPLERELVHGKRIVVTRFSTTDAASLQNCHVLYLGLSDSEDIQQLLTELRDRSLLTIGETPDFLELGGTISFIVVNNGVVFEVNRTAANHARLNISSKLLRLAYRVQE